MPEPTTDKLQNHSTGEIPYTSAEAATSPNILLPGLEHLEYNELFNRYRESPFGLYHAKQTPRYAQPDKYEYDHSQILEDLGKDVHPVEHMQHTHDTITQPFVVAQAYELTPREVIVLKLGTYGHDTGECEYGELVEEGYEVTGDIAYAEKAKRDEKNEQKIRRYIMKKLWPEIPDDLLDEMDQMIMKPETKLGRMFNSIERLGYLETGLEASGVVVDNYHGELPHELAQKDPWARNRLRQLSRLALQVANTNPQLEKPFQQHYRELNKRREEYPYIDKRMGEIDEFLVLEGYELFDRLPALIATIESIER